MSNLYHTAPQARLAQKMVEIAKPLGLEGLLLQLGHRGQRGRDQVCAQVCQSQPRRRPVRRGSPCLCCALKLLSFDNCFHGRTLGALALTYKVQYKTPFEPIMPGVRGTVFSSFFFSRF